MSSHFTKFAFLCLSFMGWTHAISAETSLVNNSELTATWFCKEFKGTAETNRDHCRLALTEYAHTDAQLATLHTNLGRALRNLGQADEALAQFAKAKNLMPAYEAAWRYEGWMLWDEARWAEAAEAFEQAFALYPSAGGLAGLGSSLWRGGIDEDRATSVLKQALTVDTEYAWVMVELAWLSRRNDQSEQSLAYFDDALALQNDYSSAHYGRSKVLHDLGKAEAALAAASQALKYDPDDADFLVWRAQLYREQEKFGRAEADARRAVALDPGEEGGFVELGRALKHRGDLAGALQVYADSVANGSARNLLYFIYGELLADENRWDEALAMMDKALTYDEADHRDHNMRAYILINLDRMDAAQAAAQAALDLKPDHYAALYNKALTQVELGQLTEAYNTITAAHDAGMTPGDVNDFIAYLYSMNQYAFALRLRAEITRRDSLAKKAAKDTD